MLEAEAEESKEKQKQEMTQMTGKQQNRLKRKTSNILFGNNGKSLLILYFIMVSNIRNDFKSFLEIHYPNFV